MKTRRVTFLSKAALSVAVSAAAFVLHTAPAKANAASQPAGITLPDDDHWWAEQNLQNGTTSTSAPDALASLDYAQSNSLLYNPAWFYDLEIFFDENLTPPSGGNPPASQGGGLGSPDIQESPAGPPNALEDPLNSLAFAQQYSASYSTSWVTDTELFLNRDAAKPAPTDVPEPSSLPILGSGILGLAMILFTKRCKRHPAATGKLLRR